MERTDVVLQAQPAALEQSTLAGVIACATKDIISKGMQRDDFEPILVAENVTPKLLEGVNFKLFGFKVKWELIKGRLSFQSCPPAGRIQWQLLN